MQCVSGSLHLLGKASDPGRTGTEDVWERLFNALADTPDWDYVLVDPTIIRAHQHSAGAPKKGLKLTRSAAPRAD